MSTGPAILQESPLPGKSGATTLRTVASPSMTLTSGAVDPGADWSTISARAAVP